MPELLTDKSNSGFLYLNRKEIISMWINRIECVEEHCPFGRHSCCFGEVETDTVPPGGEEIKERHKCKVKKGKIVKAMYNLSNIEAVS